MSSSAARKTLEKRLGDFLGFDDGVEDVLDHLLSIDSISDLLDYLEQLLGSRDDKVKAFVEDVGKFQQGLPIETLDFGGSENPSNEGAPQKPSQKPASENQKKSSLATDTEQKTKNADAMNATKQQPATKGHSAEGNKSVPAKKDQPAAATATAKTSSNKNQYKKDNPNAKKKEQPVSLSKKETGLNVEKEQPKKAHGPPPKGTAKRNCGCFGTLHKPLTNCLYCGRITCEEEGFDFCPFCGYLVEEVKPPEGESDSSKARAWQHKERLLRYDREFTKRTQIFDDQADYYSNQTSTWLTEEEQLEAEQKNEEQRTDLHTRRKQVLNIAF